MENDEQNPNMCIGMRQECIQYITSALFLIRFHINFCSQLQGAFVLLAFFGLSMIDEPSKIELVCGILYDDIIFRP